MSTAPFTPPPAPARTAGRPVVARPARQGLAARITPLQPMQPMQPVQPMQPMQPVQPNVTMRRVLRTIERVVLREGGHRGALTNAYSAVLEGERRAALRADAHASLQRLAAPSE